MNPLARRFTASSLIRFALPNVIMMSFLSVYTIVDGVFVSNYVGTDALAVVNLVYPITCLELALAVMLASGGSAVIATHLGEGRVGQARADFTSIVLVEVVLGIVFMLLGAFSTDGLVSLMGVTPELSDMAVDYQRILLLAGPFFFLQTAFQTLFVTAGVPVVGLVSTVAGGIANVVLDWLFMGPMAMGIAGAGYATAIGYAIPAVTGLLYFGVWRKGTLRFSAFKTDLGMLMRACGNGSSEMVTNLANAVATFLFNMQFMRFLGTDGVAAITVVLYFQFLFSAVFFGYAQGVAPVTSYKLGAGDTGQLRVTTRASVAVMLVLGVVALAVSLLTDGFVATVFTPEGSPVYDMVIHGAPLYVWAFLPMAVGVYASSLFTALGNGLVSAIISFARTFLFLAAALLLLPEFLGITGAWIAVGVAETLGFVVAVAFIAGQRKRYGY